MCSSDLGTCNNPYEEIFLLYVYSEIILTIMSGLRWITSLVMPAMMMLLGYAYSGSDDAHYVLIENRELAGSSQLIKSLSVPRNVG